MVAMGCDVLTPTHQRKMPRRWVDPRSDSSRARAAFFGRIRSPRKPPNAGRRVSAINTAKATAMDANTPITVMNGSPATASPVSAMALVMPANTTAVPAVPIARAIDSLASIPSRS